MLTRRRILLMCVACAVLLLAAALVLVRGGRLPRLPAPAHYANLPGAFDQALQRAAAAAGAHGGSAEATRALARLYQANRLFTEARACYRVIASGPGGLGAQDHYYLAAIALDESNTDLALAELRSTLDAEPLYLPARIELAEALFQSGKAGEAEKEYAAALKAEPDQPQALLGMARVAMQRGDDDGAVARLRELVARHPDSSSGAALLAQILGR
jgi:tetratricopeptide (TPR) repeat protein